MTPAAVVERREARMLPLWPADAPTAEPVEAGPQARVAGEGRTLGEALDGAWAALGAGFTSACLLCGGVVHPRWSAGAGVVGGRCSSCGTDLD